MARKKAVPEVRNNAPWMNTFADLMNLLLCFFVMLFAMSNVDAEKFEKISESLANSISFFDGGETSIGPDNLISSGVSQMNELGEYYTDMGEASKETGSDRDAQENTSKAEDTQLKEALERVQQERVEVTSQMYNKLSGLTEEMDLGQFVELSIDTNYQYVEIIMKGSILYDSGDAQLKAGAKPILAKIGRILKDYEGYKVEITGHTDTDPIVSSSTYRDNNWLSSARALNAAEYLIQTAGLDPVNIKYSGRGEYEPIASNDTEAGKAKNRRIEIKIYNAYSG